MSKVIFDISTSLDGFMTAARQTGGADGDGGLRLVEWAFEGDERDRQVIATGGIEQALDQARAAAGAKYVR
jgi:hypothetical protein